MSTRLQINNRDVINEVMDGEAVIIDLATGDYFSLRGSGAYVWAAIEQHASADEIVAAFVATGVPAADAESGVARLVAELTAEGLIVADAEAADGAGPTLPVPTGYEPPRLEKFTDMQDLILIDPVHEVGERGWPNLPGRP